jgi:hypothetical protein
LKLIRLVEGLRSGRYCELSLSSFSKCKYRRSRRSLDDQRSSSNSMRLARSAATLSQLNYRKFDTRSACSRMTLALSLAAVPVGSPLYKILGFDQ